MDIENLKLKLNRFPVIPVLAVALIYAGYHYTRYTGMILREGSDSPYLAKEALIEPAKQEVLRIEERIRKANEFWKNLENKKNELRTIAVELDNMKASLSESFDIPDFMKMLITEAKRVGLSVVGLKPTGQIKKEFYSENTFELGFTGAYVQLLAFFDRLSQSQKVLRISNFSIKPRGSAQARFVELEGKLQVKGYSYLGTKADEISKKSSTAPPVSGGGQ